MCIQHPLEVKGEGYGGIGEVAYKENMHIYSPNNSHYYPELHALFLSSVSILLLLLTLYASRPFTHRIMRQFVPIYCTYYAIQSFTERNSL
jgi:hypothetical protein